MYDKINRFPTFEATSCACVKSQSSMAKKKGGGGRSITWKSCCRGLKIDSSFS